MEVVDLGEGFDKEICDKLRRFLGKYSTFGKEDFVRALSGLERTDGSCFHNRHPLLSTVLVLVDAFPCANVLYGGVFIEYYVDLNCGLVRGIVFKDSKNGRLLIERLSLILNKYSRTHGYDKVKEIFIYTAKISTSENQAEELQGYMCLYDIGFRLVKTKCLELSHGFAEDILFLVYRPDLIPNYQVEDGVSSDCVKSDDVINVCEKLSHVDAREASDTDLFRPSSKLMSVKQFTCPDFLAVSPSFPWHGECGPSPDNQVVVVGAGVAGLAAASVLNEAGLSVVLVEAANYIGGRVKQVQPFPGFPPVDLGGEFIHGSNTVTMRLAKENKWAVKRCHEAGESESDNVVWLYLNNGLSHSLCDFGNTTKQAAYKAWDDIIVTGRRHHLGVKDQLDNNYCENFNCSWEKCASGCPQEKQIPAYAADTHESDQLSNRSPSANEDMNLLEFLKRQGCSDDTIAVVDARYAQTEGGCLDKLGVFECAREDFNWDYGFDNFRLEESYSLLIAHYLNKCNTVDKRLNWQVKEVTWKDTTSSCEEHDDYHHLNEQQITLKNKQGQVLTAKYVIITVPLTILKEEDITFTPSLPSSKQTAINAIQMRGALKLACRFRTAFWPEHVTLGYVARGFLSQIWMFSHDTNEDGEQCHVIAGFQTAEHAEKKVGVSEEEILERFLHQLDEMFGSRTNSTPASDNFMDHVYYHWSKNPFVRGGYSSPTAYAYGLRHELAKPVETSLFFAGEATSITCGATVHSAIETGIRAAGEVCHVAGKCSEARKL